MFTYVYLQHIISILLTNDLKNSTIDSLWKKNMFQWNKGVGLIKKGAGSLPSRILREFVLTIPAIKHLQVSIWPLIG